LVDMASPLRRLHGMIRTATFEVRSKLESFASQRHRFILTSLPQYHPASQLP